VFGVHAHDRHAESSERVVDDLLEDRALVFEVEIEGPSCHSGGRDDVVDLRRVVAVLREHVTRMMEDLVATFGFVHDVSNRVWHARGGFSRTAEGMGWSSPRGGVE
jgi:hypothetical protein